MTQNSQNDKKASRQTILFIGNESYGWRLNDYMRAARNAAALGFDAIVFKCADGQNRWYSSPADVKTRREVMINEGLRDAFGFTYCYGPRFGVQQQIPAEAAILGELADVCGGRVVADMETEWNGQAAAAGAFADDIKKHGVKIFMVSTWADPDYQNWQGVIKALAPVVAAWWPQQYTNWLAAQQREFTSLEIPAQRIEPTVDLSGEFGPNDPLKIAAGTLDTAGGVISVWEYQYALANPGLARAITALASRPIATGAPIKVPHPVSEHPVAVTHQVIVKPGDTLSAIAQRLGLNWFHDLFLPNQAVIEGAAHAHGQPSSHTGDLIYPDTVLSYRLPSGL